MFPLVVVVLIHFPSHRPGKPFTLPGSPSRCLCESEADSLAAEGSQRGIFWLFLPCSWKAPVGQILTNSSPHAQFAVGFVPACPWD